MSNDKPPGLPGIIPTIGGALSTMIPMPQHQDTYQRERQDLLIEKLEKVSTLVNVVIRDIDKLTTRIDRWEGERISRQEYTELKQQNDDNRNRLNSHYMWLVILTVSLLLVFALVIYIFANGM